jgi:hypothetical protein
VNSFETMIAVWSVAFVAFLCYIFLPPIGNLLVTEISNFQLQPTPINYCYGFYYFTVIYPFKFGLSTYHYINSSLTPYPNLNLVLGVLANLVYACIYLWIWYQLTFPSEKRRLISLGIFFTPVTLAILVHLFRWLFAVR